MYPEVKCNLLYELVPTKNFVSLSADFSKIIVDASLINLETDLGKHNIQIKVRPDPSSQPLIVQASIEITCTIKSLGATDPSNILYTLNQGAETIPLQFEQKPACREPSTISHLVTKNGEAVDPPGWLVYDSAAGVVTVDVTAPQDVGEYEVKSTYAVKQVDWAGIVDGLSVSKTFAVVV